MQWPDYSARNKERETMAEKAAAKSTATPNAAATAPDTAADDKESARLFTEMSAKHGDKYDVKAESAVEPDEPEGAQPEPADAADPAKANTGPAKDTAQEPTKGTTAAPEPAAVPADDLWAKAAHDPRTAALKQAWDLAPESARPAIEQTQKRLLEQGKEIQRLRTERSTLKAAPTAVANPAPVKTPAEPEYDLTKDPDWVKAKEEYPDALGAVESVVKRALASVNSRLAPLAARTETAAKAVEDQAIREQGNLLLQMHTDYLDTIKSEGFKDTFAEWLPTAPPAIQQMFENNRDFVRDANEAATVFTLFKAQSGFKGPTAPEPAVTTTAKTQPAQSIKRKQQLEGSAGVKTKGPAPDVSADPDNADYWYAQFSKKYDAVDEKRVH